MIDTSKLTKALSPANLAETCEVKISESFSITILHVAGFNQYYQAAVAKFALLNPKHPLFTNPSDFLSDVWAAKVNDSTISFLVDVVVTGWGLVDDAGEEVPYSRENVRSLFSGGDEFCRSIPAKLLKACTSDLTFNVPLIVKR